MKNIKTGTICVIISMTSVLVMFIWAFVEGSYEHSWLAVAAGGIISCAVHMIRRDIEDSGNPDKKDESKEDK